MLTSTLDHLVVTAPRLDVGAAWVEARLGVRPGQGGDHERMGTHNLLLGLGPSAYLEVIAVNAEADLPGRPRWFGLDELPPDAEPRLAAWVCRMNDLDAITVRPGPIETMTRGALTWRITVPADGRLPFDGAAPLLIQWPTEWTPAAMLPDVGCSLDRLDVGHPDAAGVATFLADIGFMGPIHLTRGPAALAATIRTPVGARRLGG